MNAASDAPKVANTTIPACQALPLQRMGARNLAAVVLGLRAFLMAGQYHDFPATQSGTRS
jgi:hypothetical protein